MKRLKLKILIITCLFLLTAVILIQLYHEENLSQIKSNTCICERSGPTDDEIINAANVYEGKVISIVQDRITKKYKVTIEVEETRKGEEKKEIKINGRSSCPYPFVIGAKYFVVSSGSERIDLAKCSATFQAIDETQLKRFYALIQQN